jgi:HEAT repeat protein
MRRLRFRISIRGLALLILVVALGMLGWRVYLEGPELHWLLLKLRFGNVQTRRATAQEIQRSLGGAFLGELVGMNTVPSAPLERQEFLTRREQRGDLVFSALIAASNDRDPQCRATALSTAGLLAVVRASDLRKAQVLAKALNAIRDREVVVRIAGLEQLVSIAEPSYALVTLKAALLDPVVEVREVAAFQLGGLGIVVRETQHEVAAILAETLASPQDVRVRIKAAGAMFLFGKDDRRAGAGPDVVPALIGALRDPEIKLRRASASYLGSTTFDARSRRVSSWISRRDAIIPACRAALSDHDEEVRDNATLALFWLGVRDREIIASLEAEGRSLSPILAHGYRDASEAWRVENEPTVPGE